MIGVGFKRGGVWKGAFSALAGILFFLGIKILTAPLVEIPVWLSISIIFSILSAAIILSVMRGEVKRGDEG